MLINSAGLFCVFFVNNVNSIRFSCHVTYFKHPLIRLDLLFYTDFRYGIQFKLASQVFDMQIIDFLTECWNCFLLKLF